MSFSVQTRSAAFTLVEVMMASTILVVGFIGLIQAATLGMTSLEMAQKQQVATQIINAEIGRLRTGPWSNLAGLGAAGSIHIAPSGAITGDQTVFALANCTTVTGDDNTALASLAKGFTCSFVRTRLRPSGATSANVTYLRVTYTVTWTSGTGRVQSRSTQAFFARNGLHLSYQKT